MGFSRSLLSMPRCRGVDIEDLSISQLQKHLAVKSFTSQDLTKCYLQRIKNINPRIKAVVEVNPDALEIARQLDGERQTGHLRSRVHGIPFLVKDNIATKDKMQTTAGCAALVGNVVPDDAVVVSRLRAAGGILLGKANLSEWASMRASYYAEAYSSRGGQNRNPYNLAEHPGGSSSGSATAVTTNMCVFSIGTETDGSIMFPADRNAIVGIKPTLGLTSTDGVIPEAPSMDVVGPLARSVEDAALVLDVLIDTEGSGAVGQHDCYTSQLAKKEDLKGAKFGLPQRRVWDTASRNPRHESEYKALRRLISELEEAGAHIVDVEFPSAEEIIPPNGWNWKYGEGRSESKLSEFEVVRTEFPRSLRSYLHSVKCNKENISCLEDVVAYNVAHTNTEGGVPGTHPAWPTGQDNFDACLKDQDVFDEAYQQALDYIHRKSREEGIDAALWNGETNLDGLLVPLQADSGVACSVAAKAGYPMITIPVGVNDKSIPFGLGIMQTAGREDLLIKYGAAVEDLVGLRHQATFVNLDADNYLYIG